MGRTALGVASMIVALATTTAAHAQNQQQAQTEQCSVMRAMQWLDNAAPMDATLRAMIDDRERVSCAAGIEAAPQELWPNGVTLRSGGTWYYPNGVTYSNGSTWYYANGVTFATSAGTWYYANGVTMLSGGTWYAPDGTTSSEGGS